MSINRRARSLELLQVPEAELYLSSADQTTYSLTVNDQIVRVTTDGVSALTVYLPSVEEAKGNLYSIALVTDGGTDLTLADLDDSVGWQGDITFNAANDRALLYSDGRHWFILEAVSN